MDMTSSVPITHKAKNIFLISAQHSKKNWSSEFHYTHVLPVTIKIKFGMEIKFNTFNRSAGKLKNDDPL